MAEEHVRALLAAGVPAGELVVVGRGRERAEALAARHGISARWGGAETLECAPPLAVVAVDEQAAPTVARALVDAGARHVLLEKPGALTSTELAQLCDHVHDREAAVFVGYNRRFYPAVERARSLIEDDGGPVAVNFEFTEVEHLVLVDAERRGLTEATLERWGIANSLHVIDLAFFLAGTPVALTSATAGTLRWHPAASVFAGSGTTDRGALFSYWASWSGVGRWSVEVSTAERKLVLRPLEELQQQLRGSFALERVSVEVPGRPEAKPGLLEQAEALLAAAEGAVDARLCTIDEACARVGLAERIFGYA